VPANSKPNLGNFAPPSASPASRRDQGKLQQARELLAPVYRSFAEGYDMRDLKEAKALLEELAESGH
jgi:predicted ATPase